MVRFQTLPHPGTTSCLYLVLTDGLGADIAASRGTGIHACRCQLARWVTPVEVQCPMVKAANTIGVAIRQMCLWSIHSCIGETFRIGPAVAVPNRSGGTAAVIVQVSKDGNCGGRAEWLSKATSSMTTRQVKASEEEIDEEGPSNARQLGFSLRRARAEQHHLVAISMVAPACTYLLYARTVHGTVPFCS